MFGRFLRDSAIYGAATFLARGVSLFLVPIYTRVLVPADYGAIDLLAIVGAILGSLVPLEIAQAVARYFPDQTEDEQKRGYASTSLWFVVFAYAVLLILVWFFADAIAALLLTPPYGGQLVIIAALAITGNGIFYIIQSQLRWSLRAREYAVAGIVYTVASIVTSVALVVGLRIGVSGVLLGQVAGSVFGLAVAGRFASSYYSRTFDRDRLHQMLRFSVPLVPSSIGVLVALYVDRLAINGLMGLGAVGLFGIAYRIASVPQLVLAGFQMSITPLIYATHRAPTTPGELARIFRIFAAVSLTIWLGLGLFARDILAVVAPAEYHEAASVVPLLVPAVLLSGAYVFMPGLAIAMRTGQIAAINITGGALNLLLNLLLIPPFGIAGAGTATLVSSAATFWLNVVASQRTYPVPHDWRALIWAAGISGLVIGAGWLVQPEGLPGLVLKAGALGIGIAVVVALGLVRTTEIGRATAMVRRQR